MWLGGAVGLGAGLGMEDRADARTARPGRPPGSWGELAQALQGAVASGGPAPVRVLCERAQVGYAAGRYTASRLVGRGALVVVEEGRPAVLGLPPQGDALADALQVLHRSFWEEPEAEPKADDNPGQA